MKEITENQKQDYALFYVEDGEEGFSPERNKAVIANSIKKYNAYKKKQVKKYHEELDERVHAVACFLRSKFLDSNNPNIIERYFGKQYLAYLRGQKIRKVLQEKYLGRKVYLPGD